jgi:hypothetical protein
MKSKHLEIYNQEIRLNKLRKKAKIVNEIRNYLSLPEPMVSGTGIVGLFWEKDNIYAEVCFEGDGTFWYYGTDSDLEIGEESVSIQEVIELPKNLINLIKKI